MRLGLLATLITFAGSIAGFQLASAAGTSVSDAPRSEAIAITVSEDAARERGDCPRRRAADRA